MDEAAAGSSSADLFERVGVGMLRVDLDGRILGANRLVSEILAEAEISGRTLPDLFAAEERDGLAALLVELREGRVARAACEARVAPRAWARLTFAALPDASGAPREALITLEDVSARRRDEAALRQREAELREAQRVARVGSWAVDTPSMKLTWSEQQYRIWEMDPAEPLRIDATFDRVHPDDFERMRRAFAESLTSGTELDIVGRLVMSDGRVKHVHTRGGRSPAGGAPRMFGTTEDITERVLAEQQRIEREQMLSAVFDTTFDLMMLADRDASGGWSVVTVNRAYLEVARRYGVEIEREQVVGQPLARVLREVWRLSPEETAAMITRYDQALATRAPVTFDIDIATPAGLGHAENIIAPVLEPDGIARRALWTGRDVTARKRAALDLQRLNAELEQRVAERTAAVERAGRTKDDFLASMSHELRTPLNAVLGLSEALRDGVYGPLGDRQLRALERIEDSGAHLLALISDILDLSKIEAGGLSLEPHEVGVDEVCRASIAMIQAMAHKKQQRVGVSIEDGFITLRADERRLKQILVNLLTNAVKFTPERGSLGLGVTLERAGHEVAFTVWDTGIGIAEADQERLFQPFVQLDSSLSRQHAGTGLGLALVGRLVSLHGGKVSVESAPGKGSRFTVVLPRGQLADGPRRSLSPHAGIPAVRAPIPIVVEPRRQVAPLATLVLAEDDDTNVATLSDFLSAFGYEVHSARDGREALSLVNQIEPDLVLMDVQMPVMDGLSAMRSIRASTAPRVRDVPIIALTALAMGGDRERCLAAGADEYLTKPLSLKRLAAAIEALLRSRRG